MLRIVSASSKNLLSRGINIPRSFSTAVSTTDASAAPSVFDSIVTLNFVDPSGARRKVPAYVGEFNVVH
jgi:hypothetical protein